MGSSSVTGVIGNNSLQITPLAAQAGVPDHNAVRLRKRARRKYSDFAEVLFIFPHDSVWLLCEKVNILQLV